MSTGKPNTDGGNEPPVVRVQVIAESPSVVASLTDGWGETTPPTETLGLQKTLTIDQTPLLLRVGFSFQYPPTVTIWGKWDPTPVLYNCDAVILAYRQDSPPSYTFLKAFSKAVRPRYVLRALTTTVMELHDDPHGEADGKTRRLAKKVGAVSTYRQSGWGSPLGFDAVLEGLVRLVGERYSVEPPYRVPRRDDLWIRGSQPTLMDRLYFWWIGE